MAKGIVWKGLAHVRPRSNAEGFGADAIGAYVNVMVLCEDRATGFQLLSEAMDEHDCNLLEVDLEPLESALRGNEASEEWREVARRLDDSQRVWCAGTFHMYPSEERNRVPELAPERIARLEGDAVILLDQRRLPDEEVELRCESAAEVAEAIRTLAVRGAPAIGVAAAYGYVLAAEQGEDLEEAYRVLAESRPTAVNLVWALEEMRPEPSGERARALHRGEVERCERMGAHAAALFGPGSNVLTHCNAGGLATGGYGSAVGALRAAWEQGLLAHVWVDETRPLLQGSRLTAWELEGLGIPHAVIADSAAAHLMSRGEVDCVVTGADRIAANGDAANKIGTYGLAVAAAHHRIPLYVVAPTSTIDLRTPTGAEIPIEERDGAEITTRFQARNPAFDVTPAELIAAIVTEQGVHRAPYSDSLPRAVRS